MCDSIADTAHEYCELFIKDSFNLENKQESQEI